MPVKMIGDILTAQLPHMQPYIRFCSCQLNGAALIQQKTDEAPDFKDFVKVRSRAGRDPAPSGHPGPLGASGANSMPSSAKGQRGPRSWLSNRAALAGRCGCDQYGGGGARGELERRQACTRSGSCCPVASGDRIQV